MKFSNPKGGTICLLAMFCFIVSATKVEAQVHIVLNGDTMPVVIIEQKGPVVKFRLESDTTNEERMANEKYFMNMNENKVNQSVEPESKFSNPSHPKYISVDRSLIKEERPVGLRPKRWGISLTSLGIATVIASSALFAKNKNLLTVTATAGNPSNNAEITMIPIGGAIMITGIILWVRGAKKLKAGKKFRQNLPVEAY